MFEYPIENNFTYHSPTPEKQEKYVRLREEAKNLAKSIQELCPGSPEATLALRQLEMSIFWANASIARNP